MSWFTKVLTNIFNSSVSEYDLPSIMKEEKIKKDKLSKNFNYSEFACHDGTPYPKEWVETKLKPLVRCLEVIREHFGNKSITITSGYRTASHNKKVGGAKLSKHVEGIAVDFKVEGVNSREVADKVRQLMAKGKIIDGGVGSYSAWVHYDIRGSIAYWNK